MNIFIRELKANRKALIIWSACMALFVLAGMSKYTAYSAGGASADVFNDMSKTMRAMLGIADFDVSVMSGFFAFLFPYIEVTVGIHAAILGAGMIAKEERDKTTEFLIVKPVSRAAIITSKLLAALVNVAVINIVTLLSSLAMVPVYNKGEDISAEIIMFLVSMFIVQLIFLSLGALLAALLRKPKASGSIATGVLLSAYVISKVTDINEDLNVINIFSPLKYFSLTRIVNGDGLDLVIVLLCLLLIGIFSALTYFFYLRRDLNV
jgi:ABC-2 type transport system permease protein